ncbi:MAG: EAL domain-containing protein, partial [Gammaproteobacteria bacterium]|nr:EAL domain-containing protein [Gammaproteobacteria bacterium]
IDIEGHPYQLVLLEDSTELIDLQHMLESEKTHLEDRVVERTYELEQQITQKKTAQIKLEKMALTDTLTALPNRAAFEVQLQHALDRSRTDTAYKFAILFIDLDGFKIINDTFGRHTGDELLQEISHRMQSIVRGSDVVARIGGDEFICLLHTPGGESRIVTMAKIFLNEIAKPIVLSGNRKMSVSASIGICAGTGNETEASRIMTMSDLAMYEAKHRGKNRYEIFSESMWQQMQENVSLTSKMDQAFENKEFMPYYQPICDLDGNIIGAEVLSRWCHEGEMIPPGKFIPVLEQRGLIRKYTNNLIENVVQSLQQYEHLPRVSINLSIQQFYDEDFLAKVDQIFDKSPELRQRTSFEITESMFNQDPELIMYKINQLSERGFKIYIDDFGTGYSSFAYIRKFTADVVKIDREFVMNIEQSEKDLQLLKGMIALMKSLDMEVVIEGVETKQQLDKIRALEQTVKIQGYYFYKALPLEQFLAVLENPQQRYLNG